MRIKASLVIFAMVILLSFLACQMAFAGECRDKVTNADNLIDEWDSIVTTVINTFTKNGVEHEVVRITTTHYKQYQPVTITQRQCMCDKTLQWEDQGDPVIENNGNPYVVGGTPTITTEIQPPLEATASDEPSVSSTTRLSVGGIELPRLSIRR